MRKKRYEHRGKPPVHDPVKHVETGEVYDTYTAAAKAIGGNRWGVRFTAMGIQDNHLGQHYVYVKKPRRIT